MWIVSRVHGDDGGGRTLFGKHADQDKEGVVDPVEAGVLGGIEACGSQHLEYAFARWEVGHKLVRNVFRRVNIGQGGLRGFGVGRDLDFIANSGPVGSL